MLRCQNSGGTNARLWSDIGRSANDTTVAEAGKAVLPSIHKTKLRFSSGCGEVAIPDGIVRNLAKECRPNADEATTPRCGLCRYRS
jgi:hypothetical protein